MAKKKSVKAATGLNAVYTEVARVADTDGLQVTGADTKRVLACFFDVLAGMPPGEAVDVVAKGLKLAEKRRSK